MKIYNYEVNELPFVLIAIWTILSILTFVDFGLVGFIVCVLFLSMMFIPILFVIIHCFGFIEKIDEYPNIKSSEAK